MLVGEVENCVGGWGIQLCWWVGYTTVLVGGVYNCDGGWGIEL